MEDIKITYKDYEIKERDKIKSYNMVKLDLGSLEGNQTFKFEPKDLVIKVLS